MTTTSHDPSAQLWALVAALRALYAQRYRTDSHGGAESALWYWLAELERVAEVALFDDDQPTRWLRDDESDE